MSTVSLTSPPEKSSRRVRFSLPEAKLNLYSDKRTLHGTTKYVNGTLINVTSSIHSANEKTKNEINGVFKSSLKSNGAAIPAKETSQYKVSLNVRPTSFASGREHGRNSLPTTTSAGFIGRRKQIKARNDEKSFNTLPIIERKSSSLDEFDEDSLEGSEFFEDGKSKLANGMSRYKSSDDLRDSSSKNKSSVAKLPEHPNFVQKKTTSNTLKVPEFSDITSKRIIFLLFPNVEARFSICSAIFAKL